MIRPKGKRESPLEADCVAWARSRGIQVSKNTQCIGMPDRTFYLPGGRPMVPEFKREDGRGKTSPAQIWHLATLRKAGYDAPLVNDWDTFVKLMKRRGLR